MGHSSILITKYMYHLSPLFFSIEPKIPCFVINLIKLILLKTTLYFILLIIVNQMKFSFLFTLFYHKDRIIHNFINRILVNSMLNT